MDSVIRVDMTTLQVRAEPAGDKFLQLGGRALTAAVLTEEVDPGCHALGSGNKLVIAPGLLTGTAAANSGRLSIGAKSPLTGGIKESNVGGTFGTGLARLGVRAIIVEGMPPSEEWYVLRISPQGEATLSEAKELVGLGNYATIEELKRGAGKKVCALSIGPAGEMLMPSASIACTSTDGTPSRHAGRGGLGAVMGAKHLKAIVVEQVPSKKVPIEDEALAGVIKSWRTMVHKDPISEALRTFGTPVSAEPISEVGAYPTLNFSSGRPEDITKVSGATIAELITKRGGKTGHAACTSCVIGCSNEFVDDQGEHVTSGFEYETICLNGTNCGITDLDHLARVDGLCDDIGVDSIEIGAAIGVAMEAGLLTFGDMARVIELLDEVKKGSPLGRLLAAGAGAVGAAYGVRRVPTVKNQSMAGYDPRAILGMGVGYATSPMGADHTACFAPTSSVFQLGGYVDPLDPTIQIEYARRLQVGAAMLDSLGLCSFVAFPLANNGTEGYELLAALVGARVGRELGVDELTDIGKDVLSVEQAFNRAAGMGKETDRLPEFFVAEPVDPQGVTFTVPDDELDTVLEFEPLEAQAKAS